MPDDGWAVLRHAAMFARYKGLEIYLILLTEQMSSGSKYACVVKLLTFHLINSTILPAEFV